jgi:hypothetical protein
VLYRRRPIRHDEGMPTTHQPAPIESIVEAWQNGATMQDIAEAAGVSRQRISQRLIEAGYSPAQRRARAKAERAGERDAYAQQRATTLAVRADARDDACDRFLALCRELGVSPQTLGQYVAKAGTYARDTNPKPGRYGRGKLPGRQTTQGNAVVRRAREAAAPWSARHIANLAARRRA